MLTVVAEAAVRTGYLARARTLLITAEATARSITNPDWQANTLVVVAEAAVRTAELAQAATLLTTAEATARSITNPDSEPGLPGPWASPTPPRHEPGPSELDHRKRSTPSVKLSNAAYDVAAEVLTDGWQETVAKHLASALDDELWRALAGERHNSGLCPLLAETADRIDESSGVLKKAAGWITQKILRVLHRPRLEQRIARVIVEQAVPTVFESQAEVAARSLRIVGIWLCLVERRPLRGCMCWRSLAEGRTEDVIRQYLERELTDLAGVSS